MDFQTTSAPIPGIHTCPQCGSSNITYDWEAIVSLQIKDGVPKWINFGGCTDSIPLQVFCYSCGVETQGSNLSDDQSTAACEVANALYAASNPTNPMALANGLLLAGSD